MSHFLPLPEGEGAPPIRERIEGHWLVQEHDGCTCAGGAPYPHEPGCGTEPLVDLRGLPGWDTLEALVLAEHGRPHAVPVGDSHKFLDVALAYGFRRRCSWCHVVLRGWQLNMCRGCRRHVGSDTPPCRMGSRAYEAPDAWRWRR